MFLYMLTYILIYILTHIFYPSLLVDVPERQNQILYLLSSNRLHAFNVIFIVIVSKDIR